ncbi:unnamed protein product [Lupinus luteus]|uniref:Uncharacterized protein n=1 Tax=Lupinus luteus TaxID=3873 RepID=A0AAV1XYI0_LUPLU
MANGAKTRHSQKGASEDQPGQVARKTHASTNVSKELKLALTVSTKVDQETDRGFHIPDRANYQATVMTDQTRLYTPERARCKATVRKHGKVQTKTRTQRVCRPYNSRP